MDKKLADIFTNTLDEARFYVLKHKLNIIDSRNLERNLAHTLILSSLYCLNACMELGGV